MLQAFSHLPYNREGTPDIDKAYKAQLDVKSFMSHKSTTDLLSPATKIHSKSLDKDNNNCLNIKRKRDQKSQSKAKLKKMDHSTCNITLNQILIKDISLINVPFNNLIIDDQDLLKISILKRMINEGDYFKLKQETESEKEKEYPNVSSEDLNLTMEELQSKKTLLLTDDLKNILEKISDTNKQEKVSSIIVSQYKQMNSIIKQIEKNFTGKKKKELNEALCSELAKTIQRHNLLVVWLNNDAEKLLMTEKNLLFINEKDKEKRSNKKLKRINTPKIPQYECTFCGIAFENGQGLGGHISRKHRNQSEKYKAKLATRNQRTDKREQLMAIKRILFKEKGYDFDQYNTEELRKDKKEILHSNKDRYLALKKQFKAGKLQI